MKICIIGAGRMAHSLLLSLEASSEIEVHVYTRSRPKLDELSNLYHIQACYQLSDIPDDCDLYALAVPDRAISEVSEALTEYLDADKLIIHHSGSQSLDLVNRHFHNRAVIWPVMSLEEHGTSLSNVPLIYDFEFDESEEKQKMIFHALLKALGKNIQQLGNEQRKILHLAAVMSNNFITHLMSSCRELLSERGVEADLLLPILVDTINEKKYQDPKAYQTGPAARKDIVTINEHLELLKGSGLEDVYEVISNSIIRSEKAK